MLTIITVVKLTFFGNSLLIYNPGKNINNLRVKKINKSDSRLAIILLIYINLQLLFKSYSHKIYLRELLFLEKCKLSFQMNGKPVMLHSNTEKLSTTSSVLIHYVLRNLK